MPKKILIRCLLFACVFAITPTPVLGGFGAAFKAGAAANRYNTTNNMIEGDHRTQEHNGAYSENSSRSNQSSISKDDLVLLGFFGLMAAIGYWIWNRRKSQKSGKHTIQTESVSTPVYPTGQILSYSSETKIGTISASDGKRYEFSVAQYIGDDSLIQWGAKVELIFDEQGNLHEIYPFGTVPAPMSSELDNAQQVEAEEVYIDSSDLSGPVEKLTGFVKQHKLVFGILAAIPIILALVWYFYTPHIADRKDAPKYVASYCLDQPIGQYQYMDEMRKYADKNDMVHLVVRFKQPYSGINTSGFHSGEWYFYENGEHIKTMYFHPNGRLHYQMLENIQNGTVRYMDQNGKLEKVVTYTNGEGKFEKKYTNGTIAFVENYISKGLLSSGQLNSRLEWYPDGKKKCETTYDNYSVLGHDTLQQCYFPNGQQAVNRNDNSNDREIDSAYYVDPNWVTGAGNLPELSRTNRIAVNPNLASYAEDQKKVVLQGYHRSSDSYSGLNKYQIEYVFDTSLQPERCDEQMKQGLAMIYDLPQGSPRTRTVNGVTCMDDLFVRNGKFKAWSESGTLIKEANYDYGKLDGDVKEWNSDGELVEYLRYKDGKFLVYEKKKQGQ